MSKIVSIGTASPSYRTRQKDILNFMHEAYNHKEASRKLNALFRFSGIENRYSVLPDFNITPAKQLFFNGNSPQPQVDVRLDTFKEKALPLAKDAIDAAFKNIQTPINTFGVTHIITVTCTGLYAPGLDAELIKELELPEDTSHTAVNFLGCNAAFHALKMGDYICRAEAQAKVLIVCVELCTLHFRPKDNSDNLLANTLFADGAAAVIMCNDAVRTKSKVNLRVKGFHSYLLDKGKELMGWDIKPLNFEMILNARIPDLIGDEIKDLLHRVGDKLQVDVSKIDNYAVHPGGKKILDSVKNSLGLMNNELELSYQVLQQYGNMSSPTILFILKAFLDLPDKYNENIYSVGFGPGLSIESALFEYGK